MKFQTRSQISVLLAAVSLAALIVTSSGTPVGKKGEIGSTTHSSIGGSNTHKPVSPVVTHVTSSRPPVKEISSTTTSSIDGLQTEISIGLVLTEDKKTPCSIGNAACDLHCQFVGYRSGNCDSNRVCACGGHSE